MELIVTDELLFYGGMLTAGVSAVLAMFFFFVSKIRKERLKARLDAEYGLPEQKRKKKKGQKE